MIYDLSIFILGIIPICTLIGLAYCTWKSFKEKTEGMTKLEIQEWLVFQKKTRKLI
jgi:hypothetical protein